MKALQPGLILLEDYNPVKEAMMSGEMKSKNKTKQNSQNYMLGLPEIQGRVALLIGMLRSKTWTSRIA